MADLLRKYGVMVVDCLRADVDNLPVDFYRDCQGERDCVQRTPRWTNRNVQQDREKRGKTAELRRQCGIFHQRDNRLSVCPMQADCLL
jgi:hypothetical protein